MPPPISVPMSSILDALEGVLTASQRDALIAELIGVRSDGVAPGDLITAELFNQHTIDINALSVRLAVLEGASGAPVIERILPEGAPLKINALMTVVGRNFDPEARRNKIVIGGVEIVQFRGESSPNTLIFPIPDLFSGLPRSFDVHLETGGRSSNTLSVRLEPPVRVQAGRITIAAVSQPVGTIIAGQPLSFAWDVTAETLFEDVLALDLVVTNTAGATAAEWQATFAVQGGASVAVTPGLTRRVTATVTVPAGATRATLALRATTAGATITQPSATIAIAVNAPLEENNPAIGFSFDAGPFANSQSPVQSAEVVVGGRPGLLVRRNRTGEVSVSIDYRPGAGPSANFTYAVSHNGPAGKWTIAGFAPLGDNAVTAGESRPVTVTLGSTATAVIGDLATLRVLVRQGRTGAGIAPYQSFTDIPMQIIA